jgi:integrase
LRSYSRLRDRLCPIPDTAAFFLSPHRRRLHRSTVHRLFPQLIREVGLEGRGHRARPRPHDLRHTYAVRTLLDWHRSGADVQRMLPLLATFLGHAHPASSYWYLEAVPELLELLARRLDGALGEAP